MNNTPHPTSVCHSFRINGCILPDYAAAERPIAAAERPIARNKSEATLISCAHEESHRMDRFARIFAVVALCLVALMPAPAMALTKIISIPFDPTWSQGHWGCGDQLPLLYSGSFTTSFAGSLPFASKVTLVKITSLMRRGGQYYFYGDVDPVVGFAIDGQAFGTNTVPFFVLCPIRSDLIPYTFEQSFPEGFPAYSTTGWNTLSISVSGGTCPDWCGVTLGEPVAQVEVEYTAGYEVSIESGDGQRGATTGPVDEPLRVRLSTPDPNPQYAGKKVVFTVKQSAGAGATVGSDELATPQTYTATADTEGYAEAMLVLGTKAGTYTVEASSPLSVTNQTVTFTATAVKPGQIRVARDQPLVTSASPTYAVSLVQQPKFYAIGVDTQGTKIGRVKCNWSLASSAKNGGSGTLNPSLTTVSAVTFTPQKLGLMTMAAKPNLTGVASANAGLLIGGIFVQVAATFDLQAPIDDLPKFLPGSDVNGNSLPVPNPADGTKEIQSVTLHLLTDPGLAGTVAYQLKNVSSYPGVAMNWPITDAGTGKDLDFGSGAQSTAAIALDVSGDTKTKLYIYDYGAHGELTATVTTSRMTYTITHKLPKDNDGNGLPDNGWKATPDTLVSSVGLVSGSDDDAAISSTNTTLGDGLSNLEEYRGFLILGTHCRTDPRQKDLFLDVDPEILIDMNALSVFADLPLRLRYLGPEEVVGTSVANRYERNRPVINPNRAGISGARPDGKRAVRVVYQLNHPPVLQDPLTLNNYEVWSIGYLGITIPDEFTNLYTLNAIGNAPAIHSPDHVQVVEIYPRGFNRALHTDFTAIYRDAAGNPVPDCPSVPAGTPCDYYDTANGLIHAYVEGVLGLDRIAFQLHTVLDPFRYPFPDWYTKSDSKTCSGGVVEETTKGLTDDQMRTLRAAYSGHELGHAVHMEHTAVCGNIMYDNQTTPRQTMADVLPIFGTFTTLNLDQIVLTEP